MNLWAQLKLLPNVYLVNHIDQTHGLFAWVFLGLTNLQVLIRNRNHGDQVYGLTLWIQIFICLLTYYSYESFGWAAQKYNRSKLWFLWVVNRASAWCLVWYCCSDHGTQNLAFEGQKFRFKWLILSSLINRLSIDLECICNSTKFLYQITICFFFFF